MTEHTLTPESDHTRVAPTAWGVAYLRAFSDIPLAQEVFEILDSNLQADGQESVKDKGDRDHLAPQLEARYKLVDNLLLSTGIEQVLELASGVATHGINLTRSSPKFAYVETDLPDVLAHKQSIYAALGLDLPANLHTAPADALNEADLRKASSSLSPNKPLVIMHEGLMRYLRFDEKAKLAKIVHKLLSEYGGAWVTPDISMRQALSREDEKATGHTDSLKQTTGIDIEQNVFEDDQHAREFFEGLGFSVEQHSFLEVTDQLVSPAKLDMSDEEVVRLNEPCIAFVMRPR